MRLFLLSLLAIGSVQSHSIGSTGSGYAYRSGLLAYSPARGEFPVQSTLAKGYLRYIDGSGTQRLDSYWYPEPLNGVRQYVAPSSEEFFRAWCEQRYRDIQAEIERMRVAGVIPSQDMLAQLQPLRKILSTSNAAPSETAEVQQATAQHLGSWNEARLRHLYAHQFAKDEHFRLYNQVKERDEQARDDREVKYVNAGTKQAAENVFFTSSPNVKIVLKQADQQVAVAQETPAGVTHLKSVSSFIQEHPLGVPFQQLAVGLRSVAGFDAPTEQQLRTVEETPEVKRAREEHLKLKKAQEDAIASQQQIIKTKTAQKTVVEKENLKAQQPIQPENSFSATAHQLSTGLKSGATSKQIVANQLAQTEETAEVKRAREEHLKLVEEAKLRATQYQTKTAQPDGQKVIYRVEIAGKLREELEELEAERLREEQRSQEEKKLHKEERLRDGKLLLEEQRKMEGELVRLRQEEEQRKENERLAEEQLLKEEELLMLQRKETERLIEEQRLKNEEALSFKREESERFAEQQRQLEEEKLLKEAEKSEQIDEHNEQNSAIVQKIREDIQQSAEGQRSFIHNPNLVQIAGPSGLGANFLIAEQRPVQQNAATVRYYLPAATTGSHSQVYLNQVQPFAPSYTFGNRPEWLKQEVASVKVILPQPQALVDERQFRGTKQVQSSVEALSELEKATREHFRAHEIALEQLRLANLKDSKYTDCA